MHKLILLALLLVPPDGARLIFTKSFPGSIPEFYRVTLAENGEAVYEVSPEDPKPQNFKVSADLAKQAFELSGKLNHFRGESLETKRKIAFMGKKTLVYENGSERGEATFNYSENPDAIAMVELFEKLSSTRQFIYTLERQLRYDKLGLMKELLQVEMSLDRRSLAEPALLVPVLEQISGNKTVMSISQQRARIILAKIQDSK